MKSRCVVCGVPFAAGDSLQAFLRNPERPEGSWTASVVVDPAFQNRCEVNKDNVRRRHTECADVVWTPEGQE